MCVGGLGDYFLISVENGFFMGWLMQFVVIQWVE